MQKWLDNYNQQPFSGCGVEFPAKRSPFASMAMSMMSLVPPVGVKAIWLQLVDENLSAQTEVKWSN